MDDGIMGLCQPRLLFVVTTCRLWLLFPLGYEVGVDKLLLDQESPEIADEVPREVPR